MRRFLIAALVAVPLGVGWAAADNFQDARYERRCVKSADDIDLCYSGYAGRYRRMCDAGHYPPGPLDAAWYGSHGGRCIQGWLNWDEIVAKRK